MVEERVTDGTRIAELLAAEVEGRSDGGLGALSVTDADPDVVPTADGARAFDVTRDGTLLARAFVHDDRAHLAFAAGREAALEAAAEAGLRARPKATKPPRTLVFVERGADVKRATDVLSAAALAVETGDDG